MESSFTAASSQVYIRAAVGPQHLPLVVRRWTACRQLQFFVVRNKPTPLLEKYPAACFNSDVITDTTLARGKFSPERRSVLEAMMSRKQQKT